MPLPAQVKLLRAIQEGEVEPVGARKPIKVDVRLISATNRDLIADVKAGRFREDLFYRLHVFPITVPPLRERPADIPALARHFLARFAAEEGKRIRLITPEALRVLSAFRWPGNIRQLENTVFRAVVLAESDEVGLAEFPQIAAQFASQCRTPSRRCRVRRTRRPPRRAEDFEPVLIPNGFATTQFSRMPPSARLWGRRIAPADTLPLLDADGRSAAAR